MARIRSIHPGFFTDEAIVSASAQAQVFLIGLWTQCDDQGVFEWKPVTLKMRILPAANCDVAVLLGELAALGIIKQVDFGPLKYGLVRNFRKFQRPKKPNSTYPLPDEFRTYVGLDVTSPEPNDDESGSSSPPVPHQGGTGSEIPPQMEEDGGRRKEGESPPSVADSARASDWEPDDELEIPDFLRKPAGGRAKPISPNWMPSESAQAELRKSRPDLTAEMIERRTVEFRTWCAANNKTTFNPDATWLGFMVKTHAQPHITPRPRHAEASSEFGGESPELAGITAALARRSVQSG